MELKVWFDEKSALYSFLCVAYRPLPEVGFENLKFDYLKILFFFLIGRLGTGEALPICFLEYEHEYMRC